MSKDTSLLDLLRLLAFILLLPIFLLLCWIMQFDPWSGEDE